MKEIGTTACPAGSPGGGARGGEGDRRQCLVRRSQNAVTSKSQQELLDSLVLFQYEGVCGGCRHFK